VVAALACGPGDSPFVLFEAEAMRPRVELESVDPSLISERPQSWACRTIWSEARSCWVRVDGGVLTALIGSNERVIRLIYVTDEPVRGLEPEGPRGDRQWAIRGRVEAMRTAWDGIDPQRSAVTGKGFAEYRWADAERRFSAGIWYSPVTRYIPEAWSLSREQLRDSLGFTPDSIAVTDERSYSRLMAQRPPAAIGVTRRGEILPGRPFTPGEHFEIMRDDLVLFADAQEEYRDRDSGYATVAGNLMFLEREGVTVRLVEASEGGWGALATHSALPGASCVMHVGRVKVLPRTLHANLESREHEVVCDGAPYGSGIAGR
jgi:hypothetical protein